MNGVSSASFTPSEPRPQQRQQPQTAVAAPAASPTLPGSSSPSLVPPSVPARSPTPLSDEETLSEAAARRLQAEFDALDEVRRPDATYQECLLGAPEAGPWGHDEPWGPPGGRLMGPVLSERFGFGGGLRAAAAAAEGLLRGGGSPFGGPHEAPVDELVSDAELARRLQEEERRRARRLRQELPTLRSEEGPQEGPQRTSSIPVEHDPLGVSEEGGATGGDRRRERRQKEREIRICRRKKGHPKAQLLHVHGKGGGTDELIADFFAMLLLLMQLEAVAPVAAARRAQRPRSSPPSGPRPASPDVVEVPPPHQPAPDVAAAAAAAGIQVDADVIP